MHAVDFLVRLVKSRIEDLRDPGEAGVVVEWMVIAVVALAVLAILIVAMPGLAGDVVDTLEEQILP